MPGRDPVDARRLRELAGARWPRIEVLDETTSTNEVLLADASAPDRSVLVAEHQSAGRGRFDRQWVSPRGAGLTFSVSLRPSPPVATWGWLPLLAGIALADAVRRLSGLAVAVKWPNDLLAADGRKLAGILAQAGGGAVVVGIGLNVSTTADELPEPAASSLAVAGAEVPDRTELLGAILLHVDERIERWSAHGGDAGVAGLAADYTRQCATVGGAVRVHVAERSVVEGEALGVDEAGRLVVRTSTGDRAISAGDVTHLRTSG